MEKIFTLTAGQKIFGVGAHLASPYADKIIPKSTLEGGQERAKKEVTKFRRTVNTKPRV